MQTAADPTAAPSPHTAHAAAKLDQRRENALNTLHTVMLHLAASITAPSVNMDEDEPPHVRTATQRARLCIQAAREILRNIPPTQTDDPEREHAPPTRLWRKPELTPTGAQTTRTREIAPRDEQTAQPRARASSETANAKGANQLLAAAGHGESRFGERLSSSLTPQDSRLASLPASSLVARDLPPSSAPSPNPQSEIRNLQSPSTSSLPSSATSVPSVVNSSPPVPRPKYFTKEEFNQIIAVQQNKPQRLPPHLYARILEWNRYAIPEGMSRALGISAEALEALKPLETDVPPSPSG